MLRTNLSTRPFYNVGAVRTAVGAATAVLLLFAIFNGVRLVRLTMTERSLGGHAVEAEREATRLRSEAATIRAQINPAEVAVVAAAASEANRIIDQRAFSWTGLFSQFESTLPPDVRILEVQPSLDSDGVLHVTIAAQARRVEDLDMFVEALEQSGTFRDVLPGAEETNEQGLIDASVEGIYEKRTAPAGQAVQP
jgi:hypothetical protein